MSNVKSTQINLLNPSLLINAIHKNISNKHQNWLKNSNQKEEGNTKHTRS